MTKKSVLKNKNKDELIEKIWELEKKLEEQENEKIKLKDENNNLKGQLKIDSKTSSKPSSTNIFDKKTPICNSRIKGKNPRGGKKGHKGANLKEVRKLIK
ncbi:MAG: hypothetical protein Q9M97_02470 [Candidatus Gracilibacteria bacterium]|nr:hypothetical protein [Candidatus Gracilibacteria bacterium]